MSEELIPIEKQQAIDAFSDEKAFEALYNAILEKVDEFEPDISTQKGRKELASFAHKITKVKTKIDAIRSDLTEEMRAKVAAIDKRGKTMRESLDELKTRVRKPLTDWEDAEKLRVEKIRKVIETARGLGHVKFGETSEDIQKRMDDLPTHELSFYCEFAEEAELVIQTAFTQLSTAKSIALNAEREAEERKKQEAELRALKEREAAREAEVERERAAAEAKIREAEEREATAREEARVAEARAAQIEAEAKQKSEAKADYDYDYEATPASEDAADDANERIVEPHGSVAVEEDVVEKADVVSDIADDLRTIRRQTPAGSDVYLALADALVSGKIRHVSISGEAE